MLWITEDNLPLIHSGQHSGRLWLFKILHISCSHQKGKRVALIHASLPFGHGHFVTQQNQDELKCHAAHACWTR